MKKGIILFFVLFFFLFISAGNYGEGNYGSGDYSVGEVAVNGTEEDTGGSSSTGCTYNWICTNWSPAVCNTDGFQERICINTGTCTGNVGMPIQIRNCTYAPQEPLFDIFLRIPDSYKKICPGNKVKADVELQNFGKAELLDAFMTYWIVGADNTLIAELKDTRSVTTNLNFDISMKIPELSINGTYRLYSQINYAGNKTALAGESFEVSQDYCGFYSGIRDYIPQIIFGFIIAILSISIVILFISIIRRINYLKNR